MISPKRWILPLAVLAACTSNEHLIAPTTPGAALTPSFMVTPTLWTAAGPGTVTLFNDGSTDNPAMEYHDGGRTVARTQTWTFSTTASSTGPQTLLYEYNGNHGVVQVSVFLHPFVIHNSSKTYLPGIDQGPTDLLEADAFFDLTGFTTFDVTAGDTYGYEIGGSTHDSNSGLMGGLTLSLPTPPIVTPFVTGTLSFTGWYTSNVFVGWTEASTTPITTAPCASTTITTDTPGQIVTCSATSAGGTTVGSVTIMRDVTPPVITFSGNAGSYTADQTVNITCSATDATSGIYTSNCPGASGPALSFGVGTHTLAASATDIAGNSSSASASFTVTITPTGLCNLVKQWVDQHGIANSMCQQLASGAYDDFRSHVSAQSGKSVSAANAATLIALSKSL